MYIIFQSHKKHKKPEDTLERAQSIFNRLQQCKEWIDIYEDPILIKEALRSHSNLRSIFDDLTIVKDKKITVAERIFKFILYIYI
jgi:3-keto-L-gulonate-6-phosphate decarboxylase